MVYKKINYDLVPFKRSLKTVHSIGGFEVELECWAVNFGLLPQRDQKQFYPRVACRSG